MSISSIGSSSYAQTTLPTPTAAVSAKPDTDASAPTAKTASAQPDTDAPAKTAAAAPDTKSGSVSGSETKSASSSGTGNMFKINPDGTVGPLHLPRPGHAPGVVHA